MGWEGVLQSLFSEMNLKETHILCATFIIVDRGNVHLVSITLHCHGTDRILQFQTKLCNDALHEVRSTKTHKVSFGIFS